MSNDKELIRAAGMCVCGDEGCDLFPRTFWQTLLVCVVGLAALFTIVGCAVYWAWLK